MIKVDIVDFDAVEVLVVRKIGDPEENRTPVTWMKTMDPNR